MVEFIRQKFGGQSNITMVIFLLTTISYAFYAIKWIYSFFYSIIRGKKILQLLDEQDIRISYEKERKIGITLIIKQIVILLLVESLYPVTTLIVRGKRQFDIWENIVLFVTYTVVENFQVTMITLLAYQCYVIEERLRELTENFISLNQFCSYKPASIKNTVFCQTIRSDDHPVHFLQHRGQFSELRVKRCTGLP